MVLLIYETGRGGVYTAIVKNKRKQVPVSCVLLDNAGI